MRYKDMIIYGQKRQELLHYAVLWMILFAAPLAAMYLSAVTPLTDNTAVATASVDYDWESVFETWQLLGCFFITFLLHNFFLAPLLVYANKRWHYFSLLALLLACFVFYQCSISHPDPPRDEPREMGSNPSTERGDRRSPDMTERADKAGRPDMASRADILGRPDMPGSPDMASRADSPGRPDNPGKLDKAGKPKMDGKHHRREPPMPLGGREMIAFVIMVMLIGLNDGLKYFFKSLSDRKRLRELEHENLTQKLEYLRYQVNPHFLMNTLNNIHALVDFDPEQAKETIEKLSKLMRYILYDSNQEFVALDKELAFMRTYVSIMRIRYTDNVKIDLRLPSSAPDIQIPPLIFVIFVENAFKHGVSYQHPSFIEIDVAIDGESVNFTCRNSRKANTEPDSRGGIGLQNVRKRLQLIYENAYQLDIKASEGEYMVSLRIPVHKT